MQQSIVSPVSLVKEVCYTPSLLLPIQASWSFVTDKEYERACLYGFSAYFQGMYQREITGGDFVFAPHLHTEEEMTDEIVETMSEDEMSVAQRAGFLHGWLSALAQSNSSLALEGLSLLFSLVRLASRKRKSRLGVVGGDGWPLDC